MKYFIAVAEERHFGRAAERLNISQPPLSQQIMALEREIGAKLLARTNRSVNLTQAGELFLKECYQIISQINQATEKAARAHSGALGELTIGFTSSAPFIALIAHSLRAFRQNHPQVHLQMREINTKQQIAPLLEGKLDLGIMRNTPLPESLRHLLLLREPLVAVIPQDHPLGAAGKTSTTFEALACQPFVFFAREVGTALYDEILNLLKNAGITPYITQEVGEAMTILGLVSSGLGISILPASFARLRVDGVRYLSLSEENAFTEVWLVYHNKRQMSPQAQSLMALLAEKKA